MRQPPVTRKEPDGFSVALLLPGDSAVSLTPCVRCDVRVADLQVGRTVWELVAQCQCPPPRRATNGGFAHQITAISESISVPEMTRMRSVAMV